MRHLTPSSHSRRPGHDPSLVNTAHPSSGSAPWTRRALACAAALIAWCGALSAATAQEAAAEPSAALMPFDGARGKAVRAMVGRALKAQPVKVVPYKQVRAAAKELGVDMTLPEDFVAVSSECGASAFVTGTVSKEGGTWRAEVSVIQGGDGATLKSATFEAPRPNGLAKVVGAGFWEALGEAVTGAQRPAQLVEEPLTRRDPEPTPAPEPAPEPQPTEATIAEEAPEPQRATGLEPLRVGLGAQFFRRDLSYNDDIFGEMQEYSLPLAPMVAVSVDWFPAAHLSDGPMSHIGVVGRLGISTGVESETPDGETFESSAYDLTLGLQGRVPLGPATLALQAAFRRHVFEIDTDLARNTPPLVPDVAYDSVDAGAGVRVPLLDALTLRAGAGFLFVLDAGQVAQEGFFPNTTANGLRAELGAEIGLPGDLHLDIGGALTRYGLTFDPSPGDRLVAGGAVDQYISASIMLGYAAQ